MTNIAHSLCGEVVGELETPFESMNRINNRDIYEDPR